MSQMIESFMDQPPERVSQAQPIGLDELVAPSPSGDPLLAGTHPLHGLKVQLHVCVGRAQMTVGELLAARRNEVLTLESGVDEPVDLLLEGKVVARGQLVAVDGCFGVRITELPLPLRI